MGVEEGGKMVVTKIEGPMVRGVFPTLDRDASLEVALSKVHDAERAIGATLASATPTEARALRMALALASSLADELEGLLVAKGAMSSETRLRTTVPSAQIA